MTYAGNNRTHMIRIPGGGRFEFRLGDGAANPYLLPAALLAAGLDGIARGIDPGKPLDIDMYAEGHKAPANTKRLPLNLLDALRLTAGSNLLRRELGDEFVDSYVKLKMREWNDYAGHLTNWERATHARLLARGMARAALIRDPRPEDEAAWRRLWSGYVAFYESEVSEAVTAATWQRLFTPGSNMFGRIAEWQGAVAGFTVSVFTRARGRSRPPAIWRTFSSIPARRGHGLGRALIEDLSRLAATTAGRGSIGTRASRMKPRGGSTTNSPRPTISSATGSPCHAKKKRRRQCAGASLVVSSRPCGYLQTECCSSSAFFMASGLP